MGSGKSGGGTSFFNQVRVAATKNAEKADKGEGNRTKTSFALDKKEGKSGRVLLRKRKLRLSKMQLLAISALQEKSPTKRSKDR